jgi:hypothetical protein
MKIEKELAKTKLKNEKISLKNLRCALSHVNKKVNSKSTVESTSRGQPSQHPSQRSNGTKNREIEPRFLWGGVSKHRYSQKEQTRESDGTSILKQSQHRIIGWNQYPKRNRSSGKRLEPKLLIPY